ncbi:Transcription factor prr1 [Astathelohania contejeani]|uniref:Transcription factor prr1 n=1 Tax=Astathelohania contejeani TaxID=164912 RepID=A0ABQ7HWD5_9MICR|nr:Transcription factor prr1 [Thelohania contejeani]
MHRNYPEFIDKLYNMLEDPKNEHLIRWNGNGLSFLVVNPPEFARCVLEKHFKHGNLSSFVRQLNKYDFHKVKSSESVIEIFGPQSWEFKNALFQRGRKDLMYKIKRKRSSNERNFGAYQDPGSYCAESNVAFQGQLLGVMRVITRYFQVIVEDINEIKKIILRDRGYNQTLISNVLLAEDNLTCSTYATAILNKLGCNVVSVDNEDAVLTELTNMKYDLILISGDRREADSLIREIRQYDIITPIIMMITSITKEEGVSYLSMGVSDIIVKPYHQDSLIKMVRKYEDLKKGSNLWMCNNNNEMINK